MTLLETLKAHILREVKLAREQCDLFGDANMMLSWMMSIQMEDI